MLEAGGTETRLSSVFGAEVPHFNPMRVLDMGLAREFAGREDQVPKSLHSEPVIATMRLMGEEVLSHHFSSFVPTPQTEGAVSQLPFPAGQGVGRR